MTSASTEILRSLPHPLVSKRGLRLVGAGVLCLTTLGLGAEVMLPQMRELPELATKVIAGTIFAGEITGIVVFQAGQGSTGEKSNE